MPAPPTSTSSGPTTPISTRGTAPRAITSTIRPERPRFRGTIRWARRSRHDRPAARSQRVVARLLIESLRLGQDIRLIDLLDPIVGGDVFDADGEGALAVVRGCHERLGDFFGDRGFLLAGFSCVHFHDDVRHRSVLLNRPGMVIGSASVAGPLAPQP